MAKRKTIFIDDEPWESRRGEEIIDFVHTDVKSIFYHDGTLISYPVFVRLPVIEGFKTKLSAIKEGLLVNSYQMRLSR